MIKTIGERRLVDVQNQQFSSIATGLAGRYASALFSLAADGGKLEETAGDLTKIGAALEASDALARLIRAPEVSRSAAGDAVSAIADALGLSPLAHRFLGVLAANRRLAVLPDVLSQFGEMLSAYKGRATAHVTSATPLTAAQTDALSARIRAVTGKDVDVANAVDPDILGGVVVRIGSRQIDSSIRTRLARLGRQMKGQP